MAWSDELVAVAARLRDECEALRFAPPVAYVYNPLAYAFAPYETYLRRYARRRPQAVLLGMNPGPYGMMQSGVPFGEIPAVRDWMGIEAPVGQLPRQHPKRPVEGFTCRRREVSGRRVWGWAQERFGTPEAFFQHFFVLNYCPLLFFDEGGENRTPDKLRKEDQIALFEVCDRALAATLRLLEPGAVIGVGRFAEQRAAEVAAPLSIPVFGVTHPSPANPRAHGGWAPHMDAVLCEAGLKLPAS